MFKKSTLTILFVCTVIIVSLAQPTGGGPGGDPDVPITGVEVLIALGSLLGIKKAIDFAKKNK